MKKTAIASALLAGAMLTSQAYAFEKGDWIGRIGATGVFTESTDSDDISTTATGTLSGHKVGPDDAWSLGLTVGYAITDNLVVDLLAAWPFEHDIETNGTLSNTLQTLGLGTGDIGEIKQLPPTLSLQYHFMPKNNVRPYVGAGINYFYAFDEDVKGPLQRAGYTDLDVDDSWGLALQAGIDVDVNDDWFVSADVRWIDIETDAKVTGGAAGTPAAALGTIRADNITVDPWVVSIMVGKTF